MRARVSCLANNKCTLNDNVFFNSSAILLKYGEHTWGKDVKKYLHDFTNWLNPDFQKSLPSSNYRSMIDSWIEQRDWSIEYALQAIGDNHPLSQYVADELMRLKFDGFIALDGFKEQNCASFSPNNLVTIGFDVNTMSISSLTDRRGSTTVEYAGGDNRLARLVYETFSTQDINDFLKQYLLDPSQTYAYKDLGKPGLPDTVQHSRSTAHANGTCYAQANTFLMQGSFAEDLVKNYGAPSQVWLEVTVPDDAYPKQDMAINITIYIIGKTATRLPESLSVAFQPNPKAVDVGSLSVSKLGQYINALDVVKNGSKHVHSVDEGGVAYSHTGFKVIPWDTSLVSVGGTNVLPVPMETPDLMDGFGFNILNNLWGTNYVMWYPFIDEDNSSKYRFTMILPKETR